MPLLQYRYIFDPSEVIYNQDKRILDITTSSNSDSLLRDLITIKDEINKLRRRLLC